MSKILKLPKIIKPYSFAKKNLKFSATYDLCKIKALAKSINSGNLTINLNFKMQEKTALAHGNIKFNSKITCVNCLDRIDFNVDNSLHLAFIEVEKNSTNIDDYDMIHCDFNDEIPTLELITEEVLLALPMFAKHKNNCIKYIDTTEGFNKIQENPFAVLKNTFK